MVSHANPVSAPNLCRVFLGSLPVSGASVTAVSAAGGHLTLCSSDAVAARLDEVQFELGEGPHWHAARTGELVMVPDVPSSDHQNWPVFGMALRTLGVGAIFSVPIRMGAVTLGVATLYRGTPGELDADQQYTALAAASAMSVAVLHRAMASATDDADLESPVAPALRREVHQATGMILGSSRFVVMAGPAR